jgi:hypothetical protein
MEFMLKKCHFIAKEMETPEGTKEILNAMRELVPVALERGRVDDSFFKQTLGYEGPLVTDDASHVEIPPGKFVFPTEGGLGVLKNAKAVKTLQLVWYIGLSSFRKSCVLF